MLLVILGSIVFISFIMLVIAIYYNKFRFTIIKINEAENNIGVLLEKKIDLLDRARPIVKKELKIKEFLEDIEYVKNSKINHFELNSSLKELHNDFLKILDENEKLYKSDSLSAIIDEINNNEEAILGSTKFYNDSVTVFNQLVGSFPANIVALFWHYKKKEYYNNERREMFQILNEK